MDNLHRCLSNEPRMSSSPQLFELDKRAYQRGLSCVHCGLCLPACPTYTETGNEADSPRGRIQLMLGLSDKSIQVSESAIHHLDLCLDCRACETACPSGVVYHELIEDARARLSRESQPSLQTRVVRWMFLNIFTRPTRLKLAILPARVMQKIGLYALLRKVGLFKLLPSQLRKMEQMLPARGSLWASSLPALTPSDNPKARVGFFAGCVGSVMFEDVNRMAVELLVACGAEVVAPVAQRCCGAIHHHNGYQEPAAELARRNIDAFLPLAGKPVDFIATNIAGCGAMLRDYDVLLRDDAAYRDRAKIFASKVRDISEVLIELGLPKPANPIEQTVTYHDACHLAHAQKVTGAPRQLLKSIPGLKLVPLPESDMCCGAAGTYNLTQPEMATRLAERKLANVGLTGCTICVSGNVGCALHIQSQADATGKTLNVVHPIELLHRAMFKRA